MLLIFIIAVLLFCVFHCLYDLFPIFFIYSKKKHINDFSYITCITVIV
jgi:hypothetical protein